MFAGKDYSKDFYGKELFYDKKAGILRMNTEYKAHRSDFPGFPEGPFVLMTGRLQSEPSVAFSAPKCLVLLRIWTYFRRQVSLNA